SDSVGGSVTLRLNNVPWDQVLDIVLRTKGLDKRIHDNVILVGPTEELSAREKAELAARQEVQELAPLRTEVVQVNFAKAQDIATLIRSQSTGAGGAAGGSLLSARGNISVYPGINALLIQDTPDSITAVRDLVSQLDIPVRQVRIEARIVAVSEDFQRQLGVRFGATGVGTNGSNGMIGATGTAAGADTIINSALGNIAAGGGPFPVTVPNAGSSRYNVNLPVANPAGSLAFMLLGSDYLLDLELSAAQNEGQGEAVSPPSIIVTNQQEALIAQGTEIPYQEAASSGATSVSFKDAKTSLSVTPLITPDNRLILDITVIKERVGSFIVGIGGGQVP